MKRTAVFVLTGALTQGCAPDGPLGTVGAIVTAPITAPVMFLSARMNDREDFLERARRNDHPLPPIDARSRAMARSTLEQALERGTIDQGVYWRNDEDPSGYASGSVTVLATGRMEEGQACREVHIETVMDPHVKGGEKPDQRAEQNTATAAVGVRWSEGVGIGLGAAGAGNAGRA